MSRRGPGRGGTGTPATAAVAAAGIVHRLRGFEHDPRRRARGNAYGLEAARELGVAPERVLKTLVAAVDGALWVAVVPVAGQLDLKLLAAAVGGKRAVLADPAAAERATGYVVGGISPLGQRRRLPTAIDASALDHGTVLVSAGRRGLDIELAPQDLIALTGARVCPLARRG